MPKLKGELREQSEAERARRERLGGILETEATGYLEGLYNPEIQGLRTRYAGERERARNRLAITGNRAGYGAQQLEMGRQEGRDVSDSIRRGRLIGLDIMGNLHSESSGYLQNLYNQRLQRRAQGSTAMQWGRLATGAAGTAGSLWLGSRGGGGGEGRAYGGHVAPGRQYTVGEEGPETFVPRSYDPIHRWRTDPRLQEEPQRDYLLQSGEEPGNSAYGARRAHGGAVVTGNRYVVGEEGPEQFVPDVPGTIIPNPATDRAHRAVMGYPSEARNPILPEEPQGYLMQFAGEPPMVPPTSVAPATVPGSGYAPVVTDSPGNPASGDVGDKPRGPLENLYPQPERRRPTSPEYEPPSKKRRALAALFGGLATFGGADGYAMGRAALDAPHQRKLDQYEGDTRRFEAEREDKRFALRDRYLEEIIAKMRQPGEPKETHKERVMARADVAENVLGYEAGSPEWIAYVSDRRPDRETGRPVIRVMGDRTFQLNEDTGEWKDVGLAPDSRPSARDLSTQERSQVEMFASDFLRRAGNDPDAALELVASSADISPAMRPAVRQRIRETARPGRPALGELMQLQGALTGAGASARPAASGGTARETATDPKTGQKVESFDGGKTWRPVQ